MDPVVCVGLMNHDITMVETHDERGLIAFSQYGLFFVSDQSCS